MKKYLFPIILILLICSSCKKEQRPILFSMEYELEFNIQSGLDPFGGVYGITIENIPSNIQSYLTAHNYELEDIVEIDPASARITADFIDTEYDFIRTATIYIADSNDPSKNKLIFERLEVPNNTKSRLDLVPSLVDPTDFLKEETFDIWFEMELRNVSPGALDSRLRLRFDVIDLE